MSVRAGRLCQPKRGPKLERSQLRLIQQGLRLSRGITSDLRALLLIRDDDYLSVHLRAVEARKKASTLERVLRSLARKDQRICSVMLCHERATQFCTATGVYANASRTQREQITIQYCDKHVYLVKRWREGLSEEAG